MPAERSHNLSVNLSCMVHRKHKRLLGAVLVATLALASWSVIGRGDKKQSVPYQGRGKVSDFLQKLMGGPRGLAAIQVPDGFQVEVAAGPDLISYGVFFTFDDHGRLFVCESAGRNTTNEEALKQPSFRIRVLEDLDEDGIFDQSKVFAERITMAMGALWHRGSLYTAEPPDLVRYDDLNGDGSADRREVILSGWPLKANATTLHGPFLGPDGWMYLTYSPDRYSVKTKEGPVLEGRGRVFRVRPDGSGLEWFVGGGFANPVEVVFTTAGETIGTVTYYSLPMAGMRDALFHYVDGGVYPRWRQWLETDYQRTGGLMPALTIFPRVAPSGLAIYRSAIFGQDFRGNLFSAQFNPHQVQRHILYRDGATFRTKDEDFFTSQDVDLHVTDVMEDADGSLLVLDTGAWYLHGCPVSRIAKPEFKGAVYRVRRKGAPRIEDPRGKKLNLDALPASELAKLLGDPRPAVRDRALDRLVEAGAAAVEPLMEAARESSSTEVRAAVVFGLGRINHPRAAEGVRSAMSDTHRDVRIAAARMAGLNADAAALGPLMDMMRGDDPAARRQAAEALGRIGDRRAIPTLLAASAHTSDRFVEHAILYALIRLRSPEHLISALKDRNPRIQKAALIALDQMEGRPLRREQLVPLLEARDEQLSETVLWVVGHHSEWSSDLLGFLRSRLQASFLPTDRSESVRRALLSFCADAGMQKMMAELLTGPAMSVERRLFLLDTINECSLDEFPVLWRDSLRRLVEKSDLRVRLKALALVAQRRVPDFSALPRADRGQ